MGDILPDRGVKAVIRKYGVEYLFQNAPAIFGQTDLICANLEAAITARREKLVKTFRFNSPLNIGEFLGKNQIRAVNLANNHAIDYGAAGLKDTVENLQRYGITPFGYGQNNQSGVNTQFIQIKGLRIALIGAVCFPLEGYVYLPNRFDVLRWDEEIIGNALRKAALKSDLMAVSLHWGVEFSHYPTPSQARIAHFCIDHGADIVVGHHPHVLQGIETYKGKPVFYSLGNFIFDQHYEAATESLFVKVRIKDGKIMDPELIPVYIRDCIPERARNSKAKEILAKVKLYSKAFER